MHSTLAQPKEPAETVEMATPTGEDTPPFMKGMPSSVEFNKLRKRLLRNTRQAIEDFAMVKPGERWLVALSGGKDSYGLLEGDVMVLRPLSYCAESDMAKFADAMNFPIIPCDLCGSQDGLQRNAMKSMLTDIEARMPGRKDTMIRALTNARPSHLLDRKLFDFAGLTRAD